MGSTIKCFISGSLNDGRKNVKPSKAKPFPLTYFTLRMTIPPMNLAKYSNHEISTNPNGSQRKLRDIFVKMFPNQEVFEISIEKSSTEISSKLYIGGELFSCSGTFEGENEAKEMISNLAIEFLEELSDRKQKLLLNFAGSS